MLDGCAFNIICIATLLYAKISGGERAERAEVINDIINLYLWIYMYMCSAEPQTYEKPHPQPRKILDMQLNTAL